jgi:hypothetical protein
LFAAGLGGSLARVRVRRSLVAQLRPGDSYGLVLGLLLLSVVVVIAAPDTSWGRLLGDAILACTVVVTFWTATEGRAPLVPRVVVPGVALALVAVAVVEGEKRETAAAVVGAALTVGVAIMVARDLVARRTVDVQTVLGALSLYVLLGILFASLYSFIAVVDDGAFFTRGDDASSGERLYFSLVAITTTGFGDLAPASDGGRALVALEIVLGQLYLVTVVTIIVAAAMRRGLAAADAARRGDGEA